MHILHILVLLWTNIIQMRSGITLDTVLNGELYAQRFQTLIYLYLSTDCCMKISHQSLELIQNGIDYDGWRESFMKHSLNKCRQISIWNLCKLNKYIFLLNDFWWAVLTTIDGVSQLLLIRMKNNCLWNCNACSVHVYTLLLLIILAFVSSLPFVRLKTHI